MAATAQPAARPARFGGFDPFRTAWDLLTNVKFALLLVGLVALAGLLGVVVPQLPGPMRDNPAARSAWLELQRDNFGPLVPLMERLDLFEVFQSAWFNGLWFLVITAVTVCTVSRFMPTWRGVHRPPKAVNDRYFEVAHHRADFSHPGGRAAVEEALRKRRYRVERVREAGGTSYLFAERFAWSHYGTFLSHLALLMLLVGGLLTKLAGFERTLVLAETTPGAPVFQVPGPNQLFVRVDDAVRGLDDAGNIIDYRSFLEVSRGDETITCVTTVNTPCRAFGHTFHQAAWFDDLGRIRVTAPDGRVLYDDVLDFNAEFTIVPRLRITSADGTVLFDQPVPQMATDPGTSPGPADDVALASLALALPSGEAAVFNVSWRVLDRTFRTVVSGPGIAPQAMVEGAAPITGAAGLQVSYGGPVRIPAIELLDMPGSLTSAGAAVQMPVDAHGEPYLFITGVAPTNISLRAGESITVPSGYTYEFHGRIEAAGIQVRRDPGHYFIWVAVGMAITGLSITFYVPRRRLWVKVTPERTFFAGIAERTTRLSRELRLMGADLGSRDALRDEDRERD
jgi:cytochrome c biogenesis protein